MKRVLLAAVFCVAAAGCAAHLTTTEGREIDRAEVAAIKPGATTRAEVIKAFGEPQETSRSDGKERLVYTYSSKRVPTYLGGRVVNRSMTRTSTTTLVITITDGVLTSYDLKTEETE
ncbi:MAG: outer membrane protein assembly factor BamE [Thermodesulfobacteriota bacterium]